MLSSHKGRLFKLLKAGSALSCMVAMAGGVAQAQEQDQGEIVVTALKRNTRVQDTPIAITAVTGASLEAAGTSSFTELTRDTPSLRIVDGGPGNRRVILRGVTAAGEPTVGVYYDEAPVSGSVGTTSDAAGATPDFRIFDVERAEVLRGPQGTLYGSGSMGGTLRIIFNKPKTDKIEAAFASTMSAVEGGSMGASFDGMLNVPLIEDKLAIRIVGNATQVAGYVDNSYYGYKNINDPYTYGGRIMLRFTPTEALTLDLSANYEKAAGESPRWYAETGKRWTTDARSESGNYDTNRIYNATLNYDFGPVVLTAITTYTDRDRIVVGDVSDTFNGRDTAARCQTYRGNGAACSADVLADYLSDTRALLSSSLYQPQSVKNWLNEIRLSSTGDGPLNWTVGLFSEDRKTVVRSTLLKADPDTGFLYDPDDIANLAYDRTINDKLKQKAVFAEISYKLFDKLTLTAGARYYDYKKTVGGRIDMGQEHYASVVTPYTEAKSSEDGVLTKFNISYQATPDVMVYAQAAQGFRPGGVNQVIGLSAALAAYTSDSLWNYELGFKSKILPRTYLNMATYQIDWSNMQVSARTAGTGSVFGLISNVGAARIRGVEAEFSTEIAGISFSANGSYTDAKLTEDQVSTIVVASGRKGDRIANVPKWNFGGSAEYKHMLTDAMDAVIRTDVTYNGSSYSTISPTDTYRRRLDDYTLTNLRLGVQASDNNWGAHFFVNNLFNELAVVSSSSSSNTGGKTVVFTAPPRTYGINLTKKF
ncbi:TonB-dependent receptor [Sphingobium yanoikuyae]